MRRKSATRIIFLLALALITLPLFHSAVFASEPSLSAVYDSGVVTVSGEGSSYEKYVLRVVNTTVGYVVTLEDAIIDVSGGISMAVETGALEGDIDDYWVFVNYCEDGTMAAKCPLTIEEAQTITITFETNGGSQIEPFEAQPGIITLPSDPAKDGFAFAGWFIDSAFATPFDAQAQVTSSITLYAKWNALVPTFKNQSGLGANNKLKKGKTLQIVPDTNLDSQVIYLSTKTSVATVSATGVIKALNTGSATISVSTTYNGVVYSYKFNITVTSN